MNKLTIALILWIVACVYAALALQNMSVQREHFEDGSGRVVIVYCVPFNACE